MSKFNKAISKIMEENTSTPEMNDWYEERTNRHINLVRKYIDKLPDMSDDEKERRKDEHDQSKFREPEFTPYVFITWDYKCKDDGVEYSPPSDIKDQMNQATHHHVTTNSHHPEFHAPIQEEMINREDRDKPPTEMIDATAMPDEDIMEMCADWSAMSEERGTNTPHEWAKSNVNVRWKFTEDQEALIFKTLDEIWDNE